MPDETIGTSIRRPRRSGVLKAGAKVLRTDQHGRSSSSPTDGRTVAAAVNPPDAPLPAGVDHRPVGGGVASTAIASAGVNVVASAAVAVVKRQVVGHDARAVGGTGKGGGGAAHVAKTFAGECEAPRTRAERRLGVSSRGGACGNSDGSFVGQGDLPPVAPDSVGANQLWHFTEQCRTRGDASSPPRLGVIDLKPREGS